MPYRLIPRRTRDRLGRRGLVLLLFGCAWITNGAAYFLLHDLFTSLPAYFLVDRLPLVVQGAAWIGSGIFSVSAAFRHRREDDTAGFLAVSFMPLVSTASYLVGTVTYAITGDPLWILGVLSFLAWAPIIMALAVVASWYEPPVSGGGDG